MAEALTRAAERSIRSSSAAGASSVWRSVNVCTGVNAAGSRPPRTGWRLPSLADPLPGSAAVSCRLQEICTNEPVQVTVEDSLGVPHLEVRPVILHELVRVEHIAPHRIPPEAHVHSPALAGELDLALLLGLLGEAGAKDLHRSVLVRGLAALVLHGDDDAARHVRDAHGGIGLVHVL